MRVAAVLVICALTGCGSARTGSKPLTRTEGVALCAERGTAYFRMIKSYPTLHSAPEAGRAAETVALERCKLDPAAF